MRIAATTIFTSVCMATLAQGAALSSPTGAAKDSSYQTDSLRWRAADGDFASWSRSGTVLGSSGELTLDHTTAVTETDPYPAGGYLGGNFYNAGSYVVGEAVSPTTPTAIGFSEVIASWNASTPPGTWIETLIRARGDDGLVTKFYNLGVWAADSSTVARHSVRAQGDNDGYLAVDTLVLDKKLQGDASS